MTDLMKARQVVERARASKTTYFMAQAGVFGPETEEDFVAFVESLGYVVTQQTRRTTSTLEVFTDCGMIVTHGGAVRPYQPTF